ncbi:uncharacterized protein LOC129587379 isoform X2 [Paramacrobiotus metropolitanus]|nr:uncharacterized protein LOC129587379 isoform X2 [Paramacrobiotus metropolitanus]
MTKETVEQPTSAFATCFFQLFTKERNKKTPHPWMSVGTQSHYGNTKERIDVAVLISPFGSKQEAPSLIVYAHESKPGFVKTDKPAKENEPTLNAKSRRKAIGDQLRKRFRDRPLMHALQQCRWNWFWGSSGVGIYWSVWYMELEEPYTIYRMYNSANDKIVVEPVSTDDKYVFPRRFWDLKVTGRSFCPVMTYSHQSIMQQHRTLKAFPKATLNRFNHAVDSDYGYEDYLLGMSDAEDPVVPPVEATSGFDVEDDEQKDPTWVEGMP